MKKIIIAVLALFVMSACSKEDALQQEMNRLRGTWELQNITGGIAGTGYDANFNQLYITNNNRYQLLSDNQAVQEGSYTLKIEDDQLVIRFEADATDNIAFDEFEKSVEWQDSNRKMRLSEPCCDLFVYDFERTQE